LFLFKQWIAQSDEKKALALLNDKSFVREQCEEDFQHIQHYEEILETFIQTKETEIENARNLILDMEGKIYRKIILEMMDNADYFFFLDNVSSLTREEQIRVNTLLDRR
jgi:lipopolysaccharide biosynthesis glycosyltransferase